MKGCFELFQQAQDKMNGHIRRLHVDAYAGREKDQIG